MVCGENDLNRKLYLLGLSGLLNLLNCCSAYRTEAKQKGVGPMRIFKKNADTDTYCAALCWKTFWRHFVLANTVVKWPFC